MADGADIDLYSDDIDQGFGPLKEDYVGDDDLYDDVVAAPSSEPHERNDNENGSGPPIDRIDCGDTNGGYLHMGNNVAANHVSRRHQLYIGNLTWWTTDQDITDAVNTVGVTDFQDVKFFENRANGQSKGFCVITLGSESSMRLCMDRLPKNDLHGQKPIVTLPTKQALNQFESQQKTRPVPPAANVPRGQPPPSGQVGGFQGMPPQGHPPRMMPPNGPPGYRPQHMPPQNMQGPMGPNQGPPRMQQPPMHQGRPHPQQQPQGMPRFPNQVQWNGPPRQNGPLRQGLPNGPPGPPQQRPMFQGQPGGMPPRGPRPDWNRPPMHQGFNQGNSVPPNHQPGPMMQGPPRGPPPAQMGVGGMHGPQQGPAPHVNPAFFNPGGPPQHPIHQHAAPVPIGQPPNMPAHGPQSHFSPIENTQRGPWSGPPVKSAGAPPTSFPEQVPPPQVNEVDFEEVMARNRTVSSSAIARAVSDAATGEYSSAIETLVTAISLIKQSKVAHDERCKILISSLQDTLHGIESKSYSRRERSRSRERSHRDRRPRRERSSSRYRERSRDRERDHRERDREATSSRYYESYSRDNRERTRSRERIGPSSNSGGGPSNSEHYREDSNNSRSGRPRNKSPEPSAENSSEQKRNYYDERYRSSDRSSDRDRERDRDRHDHRRH